MSQHPDYDEPVPSDKPDQGEPGQMPPGEEREDLKALDTLVNDAAIRLV